MENGYLGVKKLSEILKLATVTIYSSIWGNLKKIHLNKQISVIGNIAAVWLVLAKQPLLILAAGSMPSSFVFEVPIAQAKLLLKLSSDLILIWNMPQ